jgi:tripartite ATP-independent transporter DctM subunit
MGQAVFKRGVWLLFVLTLIGGTLTGCDRDGPRFKECYRACLAQSAGTEDIPWARELLEKPSAEALETCAARSASAPKGASVGASASTDAAQKPSTGGAASQPVDSAKTPEQGATGFIAVAGPECPCVEACKASSCQYSNREEMEVPGGGWLIGLILILLVLLGAPLYVIIGGVTATCLFVMPIHETMYCGTDDFWNNFPFVDAMTKLAEEQSLLAIPFFMVAGAIMSGGDIAKRLVAVANALLGVLPGGLGLTTIGACVIFAAISGSSPVTVITIGAIMLPALAKAGYDEKLGLGLVTSAGSLGIVIPPSIPMIIFAIFATQAGAQGVSVDALFIAGLVPGFLIAAALGVYVMVKCRHLPRETFSFKKLRDAITDGVWALFLPVFILGGIYGSLFNATEAAAISVVLALLIEILIHRSLKPSELPKIFGETSVLMGAILLIICVAFGLTEFLTAHDVPEKIVGWLQGLGLTSFEFVLLLNIMLIIVGCLMDIISAIILFVPLVVPIACGPEGLGFDPIHLALIFIVNLEIGYLTPPLGLNLFVASTYFEKPFGLVMRSTVPFLLILVGSLAIVTYIPSISKGVLNLRDGYRVTKRLDSGQKEYTKIEAHIFTPDAPLKGATLSLSTIPGDGEAVVAIVRGRSIDQVPEVTLVHWSDGTSGDKAIAPVDTIESIVVLGHRGKPTLALDGTWYTLEAYVGAQAFAYSSTPKGEIFLPGKKGTPTPGLDLVPGDVPAEGKVTGGFTAAVIGPDAGGKEIVEALYWPEDDSNSKSTQAISGLRTILFLVEGANLPRFTLEYRLFEFWQPFPDTELPPKAAGSDGADEKQDKASEAASDVMDGKTTTGPKKDFKKANSASSLMQTEEYQKEMKKLLGDDLDDDDDDDDDDDLDDLPEEPPPDAGKVAPGSDKAVDVLSP